MMHSGRDNVIVRAAIHPEIGISRIADTKSEFFIGPEVADPGLPRTFGYQRVIGTAYALESTLMLRPGSNT